MLETTQKVPASRTLTLPAPLSGRVCEATESSLGELLPLFNIGCVMRVTGNQLYSPFQGMVTDFDSRELSIKLKATSGLQLWVKVAEVGKSGVGSVCLPHVKRGQQVSKGQSLFQFNSTTLKQVGAVPYARIVIPNGQNISRYETTKARQCLALEDTLFTLYI
ncbi:PTS sugar transporter subunit IIA [Salinimonas sediminis]|uniref:PTS EIIA type-1 domain-containing protein n=1 Tax=Salinimonas sediminis TaxID=2303538 RepID=A0A346NKV1_9ALTE|nr:PTS glucose transporter subunit IIA [Salinimonas sediminis]AXR06158.1 hypothetical protein D0Y50_07130 [Salinimonas sediminis]